MKNKILILLIAALTISVTACTKQPPSTADALSGTGTVSSETVSADVTSDTDNSDDITAESSDISQTEAPAESGITAEEKKDESKTTASSETANPQQTPSQAANNTTPKPADTKKPADSGKPAESSKPTEPPKPAEPVKEKSIYDYEFDIDKIKKELIKIGEDMGLTHITTDGGKLRTNENSSWAVPVTASKSFQGASLERALKDYVRSTPTMVEAYGGAPVEKFTIYVKDLGSGNYAFYYLY